MLSIMRNKTKEAEQIAETLKVNGGYCPCLLIQNEDTKCPCKLFREQDVEGDCHCGLFKKIEKL
ncbi:ferredoxin-thioredoxin reductase catalytic domain-containing protein [Massilibacteroides sp.]|uniref:ferredoxin-thioredoxin reductase catalytic domain-containing protein n=1 Tax=Massilibacteroides sp. TaxID=2034766 RepID=UPI0026325C89|nr:ferredoxin-thioredoxin reductase catalytic domain-containing protein [Massilibacteroides sp.]MDD4516356.1 ferredoxin-thioredoxin reductase catalytic domain-containing protein [Massilibacteroides sp.]